MCVVVCKQLHSAIVHFPEASVWAVRASRLPIKVPVDSMVLYRGDNASCMFGNVSFLADLNSLAV